MRPIEVVHFCSDQELWPSYPDLPKTRPTRDRVSQLFNNTTFVADLTEFRNQSKKLQ